jgi:phosphatidylglycerophosphatase A
VSPEPASPDPRASPVEPGAPAGGPRAVRGGLWLSALGLGRLPTAPGTWTSLATLLAVAGAERAAGLGLAAAGALFAAGCAVTLAFGSLRDREGRDLDPSWVVSDEVAGQAAAAAGALLHGPSPVPLAVSFFAFRALDVMKPGPIARLQRLPGAQGVLCDDVVSGLLAAALAAGVSFVPL